jgi:hypothetical protein
MTLNQATEIMDRLADGKLRRDDVTLASVLHAVVILTTEVNKHG